MPILKFKANPLLKHLACLALITFIYFTYHFLGKDGRFLIFHNSMAEMELYYRASKYVTYLWEALPRALSSQGGSLEWLYNFIFHFSPNGFTEKPLFAFLLGYVRFFLNTLGLEETRSAGILCHGLTIAMALGVYLHFAKRGASVLGGAIGAFIISFPLLTFVDSVGYHTTVGTFLFLLAFSLRGENDRRPHVEGLLLAFSFFASHHLAILSFAAFSLRFAYLAVIGARGRRVSVMAKYLAGFALPFLLFYARDLAEGVRHLEYLTPPGLYEYASGFYRGSYSVYEALFSSAHYGKGQMLPFNPLYIFDVSKILYPMLPPVCYLILPAIFIIAKTRDCLVLKRSGTGVSFFSLFEPFERYILFITLLLAGSLLGHAILGVVTIPRAFVPYFILLVVGEFLLVHWAAVRISGIVRALHSPSVAPAASVLVLLAILVPLNTYYMKSIAYSNNINNSYMATARTRDNYIIPSIMNITKWMRPLSYFIRELEGIKAKGHSEIVMPPLMFFSQHARFRFRDEDKLCSLTLLAPFLRKTVSREILDMRNVRAIMLVDNEHTYYRFMKKIQTGSGHHRPPRVDFMVSTEFSYRHEYVFSIDELLAVADSFKEKEVLSRSSCELLYMQRER